MRQQQVTVLGECVADAFAQPRSTSDELTLKVLPGGGPANTAVTLARLGTPARLLARIGDDAFARLFREHLEESGVDLSEVVRAAQPSTLAVAELDPQGRARYSFHAEGTADFQWGADELAQVDLELTACVHSGSLALVRAPGDRAVEEFLARAAASATVCIDPNVRPLLVDPADYLERLPRWCRFADVLRLSEDDAELLVPGSTPEQVCDRWHAAGVPLVVVTRGEDGVVLSLNGERAQLPAERVEMVDTVGAGDAFTGGFLHTLAQRGLLGGRLTDLQFDDVVAAGRFGARVAALTCAVAGPNPPWASEVEELDAEPVV